jgi:folate-dependent phosphoribosylglycinamide formyltransferase PurN
MVRKRYTSEHIIRNLREAEVFIAEGMTAVEAACKIGVREHGIPVHIFSKALETSTSLYY